MPTATIHQAKTNHSRLIEHAESGEEVLMSAGDKWSPSWYQSVDASKQRRLGILKGTFVLPPEFFEPLPEEELWDQ